MSVPVLKHTHIHNSYTAKEESVKNEIVCFFHEYGHPIDNIHGTRGVNTNTMFDISTCSIITGNLIMMSGNIKATVGCLTWQQSSVIMIQHLFEIFP